MCQHKQCCSHCQFRGHYYHGQGTLILRFGRTWKGVLSLSSCSSFPLPFLYTSLYLSFTIYLCPILTPFSFFRIQTVVIRWGTLPLKNINYDGNICVVITMAKLLFNRYCLFLANSLQPAMRHYNCNVGQLKSRVYFRIKAGDTRYFVGFFFFLSFLNLNLIFFCFF